MRQITSETIRVTLKRSHIGVNWRLKRVLDSLGLKRIGQSREFRVENGVIGQINKVIQFVAVEEC